MASMSISFRIADKVVNGRSWEDRYSALVEAIKKSGSGKFWDETTSFIVIQTNVEIDEMAARCKRAIAPTVDLVLILDNERQSARITGQNDDSDIYLLVPYLKNF